MARLLLAVMSLVMLAGCATPTPTAGVGVSGGSVIVPAPTAVRIPAVGVSSSLIPLGLTPDGAMAVPPVTEPGQASWFEAGDAGVIPGQPGPAVVAGHVSGRVEGVSTPGVFARLSELVAGDEVWIDRASASPLEFVVHLVQRYDKDEFPTAQVYGDVPGPELRLITCGGDFDPGARSYEDNVVVYAHLRP